MLSAVLILQCLKFRAIISTAAVKVIVLVQRLYLQLLSNYQYFNYETNKQRTSPSFEDDDCISGSLKPDITVAEQEDGTVPQAIVKCILFLQEHRHLPTLYKGDCNIM